MNTRTLAPGVAEALTAGGITTPAITAPAPRFIDGATRSTVITIEWPVEYDGVVYREFVVRRLTTGELAAFLDKVKDQTADAKVTWPLIRTVDDAEVPEIVLASLDPDDSDVLDEAAADFLPRRFRAAPASDFSPLTGGTTAP